MEKTKDSETKPEETSSNLGTAGGAAAGAALGSLLGPIGAAVGAVVGGITGAKMGKGVQTKRKPAARTRTKSATRRFQ
jgi:phage tail tape-measure protein